MMMGADPVPETLCSISESRTMEKVQKLIKFSPAFSRVNWLKITAVSGAISVSIVRV
jgi:hypothetical protein